MNPETTKWRRGDIHPLTGMRFWQYIDQCPNREYWVTAKKYEENKKYFAEYRKNNRDLILQSKRKHLLKDPERTRKLDKIYRERRKEKSLIYESRRIKEDPLFALAHRCRRRISRVFRTKGFPKTQRSPELLGCDWETLKTHFESLFVEGMSWENRSLWHIDHIIPLSSANSLCEVIKLCHYTNLQPLWAKDNLKKSAKLNTPPKTTAP